MSRSSDGESFLAKDENVEFLFREFCDDPCDTAATAAWAGPGPGVETETVLELKVKGSGLTLKFLSNFLLVAGVEASIVYQLAGAGAVRVDPDSSTSLLSETLNYWRDLNLSSMFQECDKRLSRYTALAQASQHREVL